MRRFHRHLRQAPASRGRRVAPAAPMALVALAVAVSATAWAGPVHALSFGAALDAARNHDAAYRSATYEYEAARYGVPIARAALLPSVVLSASDATIVGTRRFANGQNQEVQVPLDYRAPQVNLALRTPIFNFDAYSGWRLAQAQAEVAEAVFRTQGLDLMERLSSAYLQTLLAGEARRLAEAQVRASEVQAGQAEQRSRRGEGTRVQIAQTQATLDVARARLLEAADQVDLARARLERLTGIPDTRADALPMTHRAEPLLPARLGDWLEMAVRQSPTLQARERYREVARQAVRRQAAGHLPRLDLVANLVRSENDTTANVGQLTNYRSLGVQLNVPLYSGGGVDAAVKQALAREAQADVDVRTERETIEVEVQRHYQAIVNGETKVAAYLKALESTALAAQGARRALDTGVGTQGEVADAQSASFTAGRDLAQARIDLLLSRVRLMLRAGAPLDEVAVEVDRALVAAPAGPGPDGTVKP